MLDAYRDLIDELLGTPAELRGLIESSAKGEASPEARAVIGELRDRDRAVLERVQAITREQAPYLRALPTFSGADETAVAVLLDEMDVARGDLVSLLMNLTLKDWERSAIHETEGEITLADEIERHVEFDESARRRFRELQATA
jgi:hypothetical protein